MGRVSLERSPLVKEWITQLNTQSPQNAIVFILQAARDMHADLDAFWPGPASFLDKQNNSHTQLWCISCTDQWRDDQHPPA